VIIEASAPTRIDLSGGTIDIWPLYLFHQGAQTVNVAIDLAARCRLITGGTGYTLESRDTGVAVSYQTLGELREDRRLELLARMVAFFAPPPGLHVITESAAPPGSGLGGSSALGIALCGALDKLVNAGLTYERIRKITTDIETQVIRVPAGVQDYYPALYGGVNVVHLMPGEVGVEKLDVDPDDLERRLVLAYTGLPHFSGTNNWEIFKAHIDGEPGMFERFRSIKATTERMRSVLAAGDLDAAGAVLGEEWENRRALSPGITTQLIDELIEIARRAGAPHAKVCGAGGGGCVVFYCADNRKFEVDRALRDAGAHVLDFHVDTRGLSVEVIP
jgi:D-glycero-alpha-D-manno-heptose-7-phosphate kinase